VSVETQKGGKPAISFSVCDVSIPVLIRGFGILSGYLDRADAFAAEAGIDPAVLVSARLLPMLPFAGQVQRASGNAKNGGPGWAGSSLPVLPTPK
jgi:hypothetical protein